MTKTIHAIYKNGLLEPLDPIEGIKENSEVEIIISIKEQLPHSILRFAGILSEEDAYAMSKVIKDEFENVNPDEWKD
ncbi:MAG: antitoxin family protein [Nitrospirota bacterium]